LTCPNCGHNDIPADARFCPECGVSLGVALPRLIPQDATAQDPPRLDVRLDVEHNPGRVVGVQTEAIHGDVFGGDVNEVQVYVLSDADADQSWRRFLSEGSPPYKFLSPYTAADRVLFKGRDAEIAEVVRRVGEQRLLVVYGRPGVGKTSLLTAGVTAELMQAGALVVHLHDYTHIAEAVCAALDATSEQLQWPDMTENPDLPALVLSILQTTRGSLVLVLDGFDNLFESEIPTETRERFLQGLAECLRKAPSELLRMVFLVREDTLGRLGALQVLLPDLTRSPMRVLPLNRDQARLAIEGPLAELEYPVSYVGDLVAEQLVPDLEELSPNTPGVQPAHLQIVCHGLYDAALKRSPPHIDAALYAELKGADGIMATYLEQTLQTELAAEPELARQVLTLMVAPNAERWSSPERLTPDGMDPARVTTVLGCLVDAGLLIRRSAGGREEYEFASETVAREVRRLAGPEFEQRVQATQELERVWLAWLARDTLATREQLRYLRACATALVLSPVQALLLLRSAVALGEPAAPWLAALRTVEGKALIHELEDTDDAGPASARSVLDKAAMLLGLAASSPPTPPAEGRRPFGPVAWSAVNHADAATRQSAALALAVDDRYGALDRLGWALAIWKTTDGEARHSTRQAELRGALADADPEFDKLNRSLPWLDRAWVWWWQVRRRLMRDRYRLARLTVGGAIGAGFALGGLRAFTGVVAGEGRAGLWFGLYFYFGAILGAALALGIVLTRPLLLSRSEQRGDNPTGWRFRSRFHSRPLIVATLLGACSFGTAHLLVAWFNGLDITDAPFVAPLGFVAGAGLSLALYLQPQPGVKGGWAARIFGVALGAAGFALTQWVFLVVGVGGESLAVVWTEQNYSGAPGGLASLGSPLNLMDAAAAGAALTAGTGAGLLLGARWLSRRWIIEDGTPG